MRSLKEKLNKQGGFTLIEMLIVVGIIAILVAVSIPVVTYSLESTRHSTDAANERAAKAELMLIKLTEGKVEGVAYSDTATYHYDAANGKLVGVDEAVDGYGKHGSHKGNMIIIKYNSTDNEVMMSWGSTSNTDDLGAAGTLCSAKDNFEECGEH